MKLIEFKCQDHRFGLPIACVRRALLSAQPTVLPGAPEVVLGVLNIGSEVITIIDFRRRIGLPGGAIDTSQRLIIVELANCSVGFLVDDVLGITDRDVCGLADVPQQLAGADFVKAIIRLDDGLCIILDPERFLFEDEIALLRNALGAA
ncbi:chemotaxis protein CheW [Noviherbaspirillum sp. Root189]|uniref:chemotaxis protein CheW n=1 Tax=Noviherbaspirillum sp. Root189 TaxID=1736487 RepID=UPI00070FB4DD|nr:chemotaxis protein CheW [Noviherbaspirillum sp. Root189]KRB79547.1 hypothetical protein ASE07_25455 [Noviherbaspirillum sp. Root189]